MKDWSRARLPELADHIEKQHHSDLREALPRVAGMLEQLARAQGGRAPEVPEIRDPCGTLRVELKSHLAKKEQVLFPMLRDLEASPPRSGFRCGTLRNPIRVTEMEHDDAQHAVTPARSDARRQTARDRR